MPRPTDKREKPAARKRPAAEPRGARIAFGPTNYALFAAGILVIVLGYILLSRGSITLAPILLVFGYVILLPAGLLVRRDLPGE
jgi:hypothetical protein